MKWDFQVKSLPVLIFQRNALVGVSGILLVALFLLSVRVFFMNQTIVVIPEGLRQEVSLEGGTVSPSFLEEWAAFYGQLLLTASPKTFSYQRSQILRSVIPSSFSAINQALLEQEAQMKRQSLSTVFHPSKFEVQENTVWLTGILDTYIADKRMDSTQKKYRMKLVLNHGKLFIAEFKEEGQK